jgi:hypothetical protein
VVLLGKQHLGDGWLKFTQQKNRNRRPVTIEMAGDAMALLVRSKDAQKFPTSGRKSER